MLLLYESMDFQNGAGLVRTVVSNLRTLKKNHESSSMKLSMVVVVDDSDLVAGITGFPKYRP